MGPSRAAQSAEVKTMKYERWVVDYRKFQPRLINKPEFRHLKLLVFWPLYLVLFQFVERLFPVETYHVVHCALDDIIPFHEAFLIPYVLWFVELIYMTFYTLLYNIDVIRQYMKYIIITYLAATFIHMVLPTCQNLRPAVFPRDNVLAYFVSLIYAFDTNTNVCPSIHVLGALGVCFAAWKLERFQTRVWKSFWFVLASLICLSTVFMKQHSVLDIFAALPIAALAYLISFHSRNIEHAKHLTRNPI